MMPSVWQVSYWWQTQEIWARDVCLQLWVCPLLNLKGKMKALESGRPSDLVPKLFYTQYEFDSALCFGRLVGFVGFFYHSSCKLRLAVLLSDLRKHLTKILYSFFFVLCCCPNIATIQQVKIKKVAIIFIGQFCESLLLDGVSIAVNASPCWATLGVSTGVGACLCTARSQTGLRWSSLLITLTREPLNKPNNSKIWRKF